MTLPRRARNITVDGVEYRWLVTGKPHEKLTVTVEPVTHPGALMQVDHIDRMQLYRRDDSGTWQPTRQLRKIGPSFVADSISLALAEGWNGATRGVWKLRDGRHEIVRRLLALHPLEEPDEDEQPIVFQAWEALYDLMFTISVDYDWRALIQDAEPDRTYPLDQQLMHPRHHALGLTFESFCAGWDTDGWYYIGIRCAELPQVEAASMNNPAVP